MGGKDVENRSWGTAYCGRLAVHEAQKASPTDIFQAQEVVGDDQQWTPILHLISSSRAAGCVISTVEVVDVVWGHSSKWAEPGKWHWVLRDPEPMLPVPAKGRLGLWEWNG
jgi:hypothetical protein